MLEAVSAADLPIQHQDEIITPPLVIQGASDIWVQVSIRAVWSMR